MKLWQIPMKIRVRRDSRLMNSVSFFFSVVPISSQLLLFLAIDGANASDNTLERLRNITKMFSSKADDEDEHQQLQKLERFAPSEKIKRTFQK